MESPNVFLFTCSRTPERERDVIWVQKISTSDACFFALKEKGITVERREDLGQYAIAGVIGYRYLDYLRDAGIETVRLTSSDTLNVMMLREGRVDLVIGDTRGIEFSIQKAGLDPGLFEKVYEVTELRTDDYLVTGKITDPAIVEAVRKAFSGSLD